MDLTVKLLRGQVSLIDERQNLVQLALDSSHLGLQHLLPQGLRHHLLLLCSRVFLVLGCLGLDFGPEFGFFGSCFSITGLGLSVESRGFLFLLLQFGELGCLFCFELCLHFIHFLRVGLFLLLSVLVGSRLFGALLRLVDFVRGKIEADRVLRVIFHAGVVEFRIVLEQEDG